MFYADKHVLWYIVNHVEQQLSYVLMLDVMYMIIDIIICHYIYIYIYYVPMYCDHHITSSYLVN